MSPSPNIVASKVAMSQRWLKLYRTIFNLFLKRDFIHKKDYLEDIINLNARIAELETKITTELVKLQAGLAVHAHTTTAPGNPTSPPLGPPYTSGFSLTKPLVHKDLNMDAQNAVQLATGPSMAPLGDGIGVEAQIATVTAVTDIGVV